MKTAVKWFRFAGLLSGAFVAAQAAVYEFDNVGDWGGVSRIEISQSAYDSGSGGAADVLGWEAFSILFNDLNGAGLNGSFKSTDPGVSLLASFVLTPDKQNLRLNLTATFSDSRYSFSTWPSPSGINHSARAEGFDASHNPPGSYWHHTTQGTWELAQPVPEPSTYLTGALLAAPIGMQVVRRLRRA